MEAERQFTDDKVRKIIDLKKRLCDGEDAKHKNFVVINMKGIDPMSLEMLAKANILALRRAKRRNMERLTLACGGREVTCVDDMSEEDLGESGHVHEMALGDDKFTFVEEVPHGKSVTVLIKGQNDHTIAQLKDSIRDGLRAVSGAIKDGGLIAGAGAFEVMAASQLKEFAKTVDTKAILGVEAFADALLVIPRTLAENAGYDAQEVLLKLLSH